MMLAVSDYFSSSTADDTPLADIFAD